MQSVDLVYVSTMTAMLEMISLECQNARAAKQTDRAAQLEARIAELRERRDSMMASVFGTDPVIGSN